MGGENGKKMVWFIVFAAWGTDTFAYIIGKSFGKHKFSEISPKKSIEGCIGGIMGALLLIVPYSIILNNFYGMSINYVYITLDKVEVVNTYNEMLNDQVFTTVLSKDAEGT